MYFAGACACAVQLSWQMKLYNSIVKNDYAEIYDMNMHVLTIPKEPKIWFHYQRGLGINFLTHGWLTGSSMRLR